MVKDSEKLIAIAKKLEELAVKMDAEERELDRCANKHADRYATARRIEVKYNGTI